MSSILHAISTVATGGDPLEAMAALENSSNVSKKPPLSTSAKNNPSNNSGLSITVTGIFWVFFQRCVCYRRTEQTESSPHASEDSLRPSTPSRDYSLTQEDFLDNAKLEEDKNYRPSIHQKMS